jgi:hypothetical protein
MHIQLLAEPLQPSLLSDPLLSTGQLSKLTGTPARTYERWRLEGKGPDWVRLNGESGRLVRYRLSDVERWLRNQG